MRRGGRRPTAQKYCVWNFVLDEWKDLFDKVGDTVFIRHPVHAAGEDHGVGLLGLGGRLEVFGVHTGGDHGDPAGVDILQEKGAIVFRNGQNVVR